MRRKKGMLELTTDRGEKSKGKIELVLMPDASIITIA